MNILHVASLTEQKANGINVVVPQHAFNQSKIDGVNVAILNISKNEKGLEDVKHFYSDIKEADFLDKLEQPFNKPDLIVFHGVYYIKYIKIYKILLKMNIPYIVFPHGSLVKSAMKTKALKKYAAHVLLFNKFIRNAAAVQFLTKGEQDNSIFSKKGIVSPNGLCFFPNKIRKSQDKDFIQLLFIGRKDKIIKGIDLLMKAIVLTKEDLIINKIRVVMIGPDKNNANKYINSIIKKNSLEQLLTNMGAIYGEEKNNIIKNSDIFIHTSRTEGLPTAVLEAMSFGLPVLITKGTNMYEDVERYNCGWIAETNVKSVAQQLKKVIQEKDKIREYGENAYNYVSEIYNWDRVANITIDKYLTVIKNIKRIKSE